MSRRLQIVSRSNFYLTRINRLALQFPTLGVNHLFLEPAFSRVPSSTTPTKFIDQRRVCSLCQSYYEQPPPQHSNNSPQRTARRSVYKFGVESHSEMASNLKHTMAFVESLYNKRPPSGFAFLLFECTPLLPCAH